MEAKLYGQNKGGMSINGIIKDYYAYAGENISAGDLVEYVNGVAGITDYGESVDTQLSTTTYTGYTISAVALDENRVFVAHSHTSNQLYLYGVICTINGATITYGEDIQLSTAIYSGYRIVLVKLDENRIFIVHGQDKTNHYLYGMVVTINGTTITTGTDTQLSSTAFSGAYISAELLPNGNIFIAHDYNASNRYLYGMVVTISGSTISKGTDTAISANTNAGNVISTCLLPNGNVFIAHSYGSSYYLYGIVVSISGTTITKGSDTALVSATNAGTAISTVLLPNGNVFLAFGSGSYYYLFGMVCSISGTTITKGEQTTINNSVQNVGKCVSALLLPNGNVFVVHSYNSSLFLYGVICSVNGLTITIGNETLLNNSYGYTGFKISTCLLPNNTVFIAHSYDASNYYLYAQIFGIDYENNIPTNNIVITEYETQVRKVTTGQFDGIAKTSGEGSPEFVEGEVKKTNDIFAKSWTRVSITEFTASDGTVLTSSGSDSGFTNQDVNKACDGLDTDTWYAQQGDTEKWAIIRLPTAIKIAKMILKFSSEYLNVAKIQGSKDGLGWIDLASTANWADWYSAAIELSNVDYYTYYKINIINNSTAGTTGISRWGVAEYIVKEIVPSTGHKDIVSIWTMYNNLIANSDFEDGIDGWTAYHSEFVTLSQDTTQSQNGSACLKEEITTYYSGGSSTNAYFSFDIIAGHIYYARCYYKGQSTNVPEMNPQIGIYDDVKRGYISRSSYNGTEGTNLNWTKVSAYGTAENTGGGRIWLMMSMGNANHTIQVGMAMYYDDVRLYDLTEEFGAGKEPTKEWCDANL